MPSNNQILEDINHIWRVFDKSLYQDETRQIIQTVLGLIALVCSVQVYVCMSANLKKTSSPRWKATSQSDAVVLVLRWVVLVETGHILGTLKPLATGSIY